MSLFGDSSIEPRVGEIRVLRSFAVADDGALLPITPAGGHQPWVDGENSAVCAAGLPHESPKEYCRCGFYAYGMDEWVDRDSYGWFNHLVAVVECYGKVIAGEHGVRAGKARIVALWFSGKVPAEVVEKTVRRYPSAQVFSKREEMLSAFPLSTLDSYSRPPSSLQRWMVHLFSFTPILGGLAGVGLGVGDKEAAPLAIFLLAPIMWLIYSPLRWGLVSHIRALRFCLGTMIMFLFALPLTWNREPKEAIVAFAFMALAFHVQMMDRPLVRLRRQDFRPVVRSGPMNHLLAKGVTRLEVEGEPFIQGGQHGGVWTQMLRSSAGRIALLQVLSDIPEAEDVVKGVSERFIGEKVDGLIIAMEGPWVHVAHREGNSYVLGSALPLGETFERMGVPDKVWCPFRLRSMYVSDHLGTEKYVDRQTGTIEAPSLMRTIKTSDPFLQLVVDHAQVLYSRCWYREIQSQIAQSGVVPCVTPGLPPSPTSLLDEAALARGWKTLCSLSNSPVAREIALLHLAVQSELPVDARMEPTGTHSARRLSDLREQLAEQGWVEVEHPQVAHLVEVLVEGDGPQAALYMVRDGRIAVLYDYGRGAGAVASVWSLPLC